MAFESEEIDRAVWDSPRVMGSYPAQDWNFFRQKKCNCHCHLKTKEPVHGEVEACAEILPNASVITCQCRGSLSLFL